MEDPNFVQTEFQWVEPEKEKQRPKGRPEYGRKLIQENVSFAEQQRKSRSVWSTQAENALLKEVLEIIKNEPDYENITLGQIIAHYKKWHVDAKLLEGEIDHGYVPKNFPK